MPAPQTRFALTSAHHHPDQDAQEQLFQCNQNLHSTKLAHHELESLHTTIPSISTEGAVDIEMQ